MVTQSAGVALQLDGYQNYAGGFPSTINNLAGATWNIQRDGDGGFNPTAGSYDYDVVNNDGTFEKTGGTGTATLGPGLSFHNTGMVDVESGTLSIPSGIGNDGIFKGPGALLLNGSISGAGVLAGQNNLLTTGHGVGGTFTITGTMNWTGGGVSGNLTIASGAALNISGTDTKNISYSSTLKQRGRGHPVGGGRVTVGRVSELRRRIPIHDQQSRRGDVGHPRGG